MSKLLGQFRNRAGNPREPAKPSKNVPRSKERIAILAIMLLVVASICIVLFVPYWYVHKTLDTPFSPEKIQQLELEDVYRKTAAQLVLGLFGLLILYFTWRRSVAADATVRILRDGNIADRYTKAIEQLGKVDGERPNLEVRLGAIYALGRVAYDSERDHWPIMELLTAYIRKNAPLDADRPHISGERPPIDIQAILTVLALRLVSLEREPDMDGRYVDLLGTRLCYTNLTGAKLQGADLEGANLEEASLWEAHLEKAALMETNLEKADLRRAKLTGARFRNTNLRQANIAGADLSEAFDLTIDQIRSAKNWHLAYYSEDIEKQLGPDYTAPSRNQEDKPR